MHRRTALMVAAVVCVGALRADAQTGSCTEATAEAYLDVNDVRARIFGNGPLFWRRSPAVYEVPAGEDVSAIFAQGLWFSGLVNGEIRAAGARYGRYEFWPGPLDNATGAPPSDCSVYDRIYKVSRSDVAGFDSGESPTDDLAAWPTGLGAPTVDANGASIDVMSQPLTERRNRVIDLEAGERPDFVGDQMLWWIMNDVGNEHLQTGSDPIGLEVHGTAFAFDLEGPASQTTFYRYRVFLRGAAPFEDAYVSVFQDPDLGNFDDDYVASDTTLWMSYTYNADNLDESDYGYGPAPPATGVDFVRGPIGPSPGDTAWIGNRPIADHGHLDMTAFVFYNGGGGLAEDPITASDYYNYARSRWKDGRLIKLGFDGFYGPDAPPAPFMYPGDPVTHSFWSEFKTDQQGTSNPPSDRRYVASSGPFTMLPGDQQEIVVAVIWARGTSNLDSITELRRADRDIQFFVDTNFRMPDTIPTPVVGATPYDGAVTITWRNPDVSTIIDQFESTPTYPSGTHRFEGYNVYAFESESDTIGTRIASYDLANGVTQVIDGPRREEQRVVAWGTDSGVRHHHTVSGLANYATYCFGVEAYSYGGAYYPTVIRSGVDRVCAEPRPPSIVSTAPVEGAARDTLRATGPPWLESTEVTATVVDPAVVTGSVYGVEFADSPCRDAELGVRCSTYRIRRDDGKIIVGPDTSGTGRPDPGDGRDFLQADGLEWTIETQVRGFADFLMVSNAAGILDPPEYAAFAFNNSGFPHPTTEDRPSPTQQTNGSRWGLQSGNDGYPFGPLTDTTSFLGKVTRGGDNLAAMGRDDYEIRFTAAGGKAYRRFSDGSVFDVPFELWNIGSTPDDLSDDVRLIPAVCEWTCLGGNPAAYAETGRAELVFDIGDDHRASGGPDDPFSDLLFWGEPDDMTPGSAGYDAFFAGTGSWGAEIFAGMALMSWNGGEQPGPYDAPMPEEGTVIRIVTNDFPIAGDTFVLDTSPLAPREKTVDEVKDALATIGIVPNPFYGASDYQTSVGEPEVRLTNVPRGATVRVFTLSGSLARELHQEGDGVLRWDLTNEAGKSLAGGIYLVHVDVPGVGERVLKMSVVPAAVRGR